MEQYSNQLPQSQPKNWLLGSILGTIFCCMPFGIVGIINAAQVNSRYTSGDYNGALKASQEAGKWTKIGFWVGIGVIALYIIAVFAFGATAFWASQQDYDY